MGLEGRTARGQSRGEGGFALKKKASQLVTYQWYQSMRSHSLCECGALCWMSSRSKRKPSFITLPCAVDACT